MFSKKNDSGYYGAILQPFFAGIQNTFFLKKLENKYEK